MASPIKEAGHGVRPDRCPMGSHQASFATAAGAGKAEGGGPADVERHPVWAAHGMPVGRHAPQVWKPGNLLAAAPTVAAGRRVGTHLADLSGHAG